MQAFRKKARSLGVEYRQGEVARYIVEGGRVTGVELADGSRIACGAVVNASGTHGARLAATAGIAIPVKSMKRYVFSFTCKGEVDNCPLLIDTTGVWCRPEGKRGSDGQLFIGSSSPASEADQEWIETRRRPSRMSTGPSSRRRSGRRSPIASRPSSRSGPAAPGPAPTT